MTQSIPSKIYLLAEVEDGRIYKKENSFYIFLMDKPCLCDTHTNIVSFTRHFIFWTCNLSCRQCNRTWSSTSIFKRGAFYGALLKRFRALGGNN